MKKEDMCSTHLDFQIHNIYAKNKEEYKREKNTTLKFRSVSRFTLVTNK